MRVSVIFHSQFSIWKGQKNAQHCYHWRRTGGTERCDLCGTRGMQATVLYKDGGALAKTDKIENYFGFIEPVSGAELLERGQKQLNVWVQFCGRPR